jgi:hypothetical protein
MAGSLLISYSFNGKAYWGQIIDFPKTAFQIGDEEAVRMFATSMTSGQDTFLAYCAAIENFPAEAVLNANEVWFTDLVIWEAAVDEEVIATALATVGVRILEALV